MNPLDERMHPVGDEPAWSESYYFNFVDPDSKVAMFTRMGFRPGDGWADGLHAVYLGGDRVAFTYGRRDIEADLTRYDDDLKVGGLAIECGAPFRDWQVRFQGPAQDIADAAILLERSKARPDGWYRPAQLDMAVRFTATSEPHYAADGARGHFEQTGTVQGRIEIHRDGAQESFPVSGFGVRDKSWGPRDWGAGNRSARGGAGAHSTPQRPAPFVTWFSMNFGAALALGGSCFRHPDGVVRGTGWIHRDGRTGDLTDIVIESDYRPGSIWHTSVRLSARADGAPIELEGTVLTVCPTKIPMPGGATFVNEGLAELQMDGRTGYGIIEHWHAVSKG